MAALFLAPNGAAADAGDLAVGGYLGVQSASVAEAAVLLQRGLTDWLAARGSLGFGGGRDGWQGQANAGLAALFDVWTWVPTLTLATGVRLGSADRAMPIVAAQIELRRYLTFDWSVGLTAGAALCLWTCTSTSESKVSGLTGSGGIALWRDL